MQILGCWSKLEILQRTHRNSTLKCLRDKNMQVLISSGVRSWWNGSGGPRYWLGSDNEAGQGTHHQSHFQRWPSRQHAVELQTAADWDLCKTCFQNDRPSPGLGPEASLFMGVTVLVVFLPRWYQVRQHWPSTEQKTPQINQLLASPPTTLSRLRLDSISTRSR